MIIAIDYDGTYDRDPTLWNRFIKHCLDRGHTVYCITMRYAHSAEEADGVIESLFDLLGDNIIFTGRQAKLAYVERVHGFRPDVWVDDNPEWIYANSL